jgi:hypothetical protein
LTMVCNSNLGCLHPVAFMRSTLVVYSTQNYCGSGLHYDILPLDYVLRTRFSPRNWS